MPEAQASILIVDDSEAISKALRDVFTVNGYAVRIAPSGERALQIMETAQIDLVITDLKMSGISGIELLKRVKDKSPALPVVILSGYGDMDSVIEAMRCGVADYLKKPFSVNEVLQVTARELMRSRAGYLPASASSAPGDASQPSTRRARRFAFSAQESRRLESILSDLRGQTSAESVVLIEDTGHLVTSKGVVGDTDLNALAALFIGGRKAMTHLAALLREEAVFSINSFEGQRLAVYAAGAGPALIVVMIVSKSVRQGTVLVYARKAAAEIEQIAANATVLPEPVAPAEPPAAPVSEQKSPPQPERKPQPQLQPQPQPVAPPVLDVEFFTEMAPPVETLSWEEAMSRGLLGGDFAPSPPAEGGAASPGPAEASGPAETLTWEEAMSRGLLGGDFKP